MVSRKKESLFLIVGLSVMVSLAVMLCIPLSAQAQEEAGDFLRATGYTRPRKTVEKSPSAAGEIADIAVSPGDTVEEGEVLLRLDSSQAEKEVEAAESNLKREKALLRAEEQSLQQAEISLHLARHELERLKSRSRDVLEAEKELAAIELDFEQGEFDRAERLYQRDAMEDVEFSRYRYNLDLARQNYNISQHRLEEQQQEDADRVEEAGLRVEEAERSLAAAENQLEAAESRVDSARVELEQSRLRLEEYVIRSPEDMMVLEKHVESDEYAAAGERVITLASSELQILIEPDEREAGEIFIGQSGQAVVEAYPDRPFPVEVREIAPHVDLDRGILEVELEIEEEIPDLLPYMTVSVDLEPEEE